MAEYLKVQAVLDQLGVSPGEVDAMWKVARDDNRVIAAMAKAGKHWSDLPEHLMREFIERYVLLRGEIPFTIGSKK